jgi:FSR family fosmidomycin resistance protein-like MFS transporter
MSPILAPVAGILLARALLMAAMLTFLPTFLTEQGVNLLLAGVTLSVVHVTSAVGALLAGSISDRLGRRAVAAISMLSAPLLMFLFLGVGNWFQLPVLMALGAMAPATQVILMALVQESCPEHRAMTNGILGSLLFISESVGAVVLGIMGDLFGLRLAFTVGALVFPLGLPFVLLLPKEGSASEE